MAALAGVLAWSFAAHASKLVILTDQVSGARARQIKAHIEGTLPFKALTSTEFSIEVQVLDPRAKPIKCQALTVKYTKAEIRSLEYWAKQKGIVLTKAELKKYRDGYTIDRVVQCDAAELVRLAAQFQADHALFVRNSPYEGGSGGSIPVILSGSREGIGLHEWLHTFGLADEYAYERNEAALFCQKKEFANVAVFNDQPPYFGSEDVRARHRDQIKWLPFLGKEAALTHGDQLGSPTLGNLGIFRSKTCDNVTPELRSWKPTGHPTIMEDPYSKYIPKPYWTVILSGLGLSSARIDELLKKTVAPTWTASREESPGSPPRVK